MNQVYTVTDMLAHKLVGIYESAADALAAAANMSGTGGCGFAQGFTIIPAKNKGPEPVGAEPEST